MILRSAVDTRLAMHLVFAYDCINNTPHASQRMRTRGGLLFVEFARYRMANRSPGEQEIKYPGKYLLSIIDKDLTLTEKEKRRATPKKVPAPESVPNAAAVEEPSPAVPAAQTKAQALLENMSEAERSAAVEQFATSDLFRAIKRTRRKADPANLDDPMVRSAFYEYLAGLAA